MSYVVGYLLNCHSYLGFKLDQVIFIRFTILYDLIPSLHLEK